MTRKKTDDKVTPIRPAPTVEDDVDLTSTAGTDPEADAAAVYPFASEEPADDPADDDDEADDDEEPFSAGNGERSLMMHGYYGQRLVGAALAVFAADLTKGANDLKKFPGKLYAKQAAVLESDASYIQTRLLSQLEAQRNAFKAETLRDALRIHTAAEVRSHLSSSIKAKLSEAGYAPSAAQDFVNEVERLVGPLQEMAYKVVLPLLEGLTSAGMQEGRRLTSLDPEHVAMNHVNDLIGARQADGGS